MAQLARRHADCLELWKNYRNAEKEVSERYAQLDRVDAEIKDLEEKIKSNNDEIISLGAQQAAVSGLSFGRGRRRRNMDQANTASDTGTAVMHAVELLRVEKKVKKLEIKIVRFELELREKRREKGTFQISFAAKNATCVIFDVNTNRYPIVWQNLCSPLEVSTLPTG